MQGTSRWVVHISLVIVSWLVVSPSVSAQTSLEVLDQSQTAYYAGGGPSIDAIQSVGQVFTAGISGSLTTVRIMVGRCDAPDIGDLIIEVQAVDAATGLPTDVVLSTATIDGQTLPGPTLTEAGWVAFTDDVWTTVSFSTPTNIQQGSQYALVFRAASPGACNFYTTTSGGNPYLGGHFVWRSETTWTRVTWVPDGATEDVAFQTYVIPAPPAATIGMVRTLIDAWALPKGIAQGLTAKLAAAERSANAGRLTPACQQLDAVDALVAAQQGKALTGDQASQLRAIIAEVRSKLGC